MKNIPEYINAHLKNKISKPCYLYSYNNNSWNVLARCYIYIWTDPSFFLYSQNPVFVHAYAANTIVADVLVI